MFFSTQLLFLKELEYKYMIHESHHASINDPDSHLLALYDWKRGEMIDKPIQYADTNQGYYVYVDLEHPNVIESAPLKVEKNEHLVLLKKIDKRPPTEEEDFSLN